MAVSQQAKGSSSELRMVLLGKTGVGKSASGNTILGRKVFLSNSDSSSITRKSMKRKAEVAGRRVAVIDTPGFFDTELSEEDFNLEILRCISLCSPGPHAFLLVMPVGRYTKEGRKTVKKILKMFSDDVLRHTIILFTRADDLKGRTIEEFVQSGNKELRELVEKCRGCHTFNNENPSDRTQVTKLLENIKRMVAENGGSHYTNEIYQLAEEEIRREEERKLREREEGSDNSYHTLNTENTNNRTQVTEAKIRPEQERKLREREEGSGNSYHTLNTENTSDRTQVTEAKIRREQERKLREREEGSDNSYHTLNTENTSDRTQVTEAKIRREQERKLREREEGSGNSYHTLNTENTSDLSQVTEAKIRREQERKLREREEGSGNSYHTLNTEDTSDRTQVTELLQTTESMVAENGGSHYTNEMYQQAEAGIRREQAVNNKRREEAENSNGFINKFLTVLAGAATGVGLGLLLGSGIGIYLAAATGVAAAGGAAAAAAGVAASGGAASGGAAAGGAAVAGGTMVISAAVLGGGLGGVAGGTIGYEASGPRDAVNKVNKAALDTAETAFNMIIKFGVPVHSKQQ